MGLLVEGKWQDKWYETKNNGGEFKRSESQYRKHITKEGEQGFKAEKDRYHLYVSLACPWAHRVLIFLKLKALDTYISYSIVSPDMLNHGWTFDKKTGSSGDEIYQYDYLYQIYTKDNPTYTGRVTVPILWDKKNHVIVNNESSEIIRMFNTEFNHLTDNHDDYYPEALRHHIDQLNDIIYHHINNGVYKVGFATSQEAYEKNFNLLFNTLNELEQRLENNTYLLGEQITEADWRLFTTLIRFDIVYFGHFKCNQYMLKDKPLLFNYIKRLYKVKHIQDTVDFFHIKRHYYYSHTMINPTQIVPMGPNINLN